jgi:hypothetical protein
MNPTGAADARVAVAGFYSIRSERQLVERIDHDLLSR